MRINIYFEEYKKSKVCKLFWICDFVGYYNKILRSFIIQDTQCLLNFGLSDRCRRSSLVATPKIIHRMIFVCDIMHYELCIGYVYEV